MNHFKYLLLFIALILPIKVYSGPVPPTFSFFTDSANYSLSAPYDLRDRSSYIQITNVRDTTITIHVQIFQNDRECDELDFFDTLTANDTVVYDLDNIIKNNGDIVPVNLLSDSNGYVVITIDEGNDNFDASVLPVPLIGNFRIVDLTGYEYRSNMMGPAFFESNNTYNLHANFNTIDDANQADIFGYVLHYDCVVGTIFSSTVQNRDQGVDFDIFVFDLDEEPLSCDRRNFACGNVMNYGVNEDYPASRGENLLCPGGGLADPRGGFIQFDNFSFPGPEVSIPDFLIFHGFIGINNGDGTGSIDAWIGNELINGV